MITAILNCYKRPEYLQEQIEAIRNQSIPVDDIMVWYNKPEDGDQYDLSSLGVKVITCNHNYKFHGRFALGLLAQSKYVCFFDDDTIPGENWFKNCIDTIEAGYDGILGTIGLQLLNNSYRDQIKYGWNGNKNEEVVEVDLVGHSWFMNKDYLRYLWREEPITWETGEDMQLSYFAQKYGNIKTYVPPHPVNDLSLWGSQPKQGMSYGDDTKASWREHGNGSPLRNWLVEEQIKRGWKLVNE